MQLVAGCTDERQWTSLRNLQQRPPILRMASQLVAIAIAKRLEVQSPTLE
jgi:hypothetical protein